MQTNRWPILESMINLHQANVGWGIVERLIRVRQDHLSVGFYIGDKRLSCGHIKGIR